MYLGTSGAGVVVLSEQDGQWHEERKGLEEHDVECVSVASDGSAVFAAVEGQGVYASRDAGATWSLALAGPLLLSGSERTCGEHPVLTATRHAE